MPRLIRSLIGGLVIISTCALQVNSIRAEGEKKPKMQIPGDIFNFGTVSQGTKVIHDFVIKNVGDGELQIQRMVAACGCTATSASNDKIAPGEKGQIHVEFDTTGFSGEKLKTVRVYTNDAAEPSALLTLKGVVEPEVKVEPQPLVFGEVSKGKPYTKEVIVSVRSGSSAKIGEIKTFSKHLAINELKSDATHKRFAVELSPDTPVGDFRDRVIVALSGTKNTSVNVPVVATVKGDLSLQPGQLSFGIIEGTKEIVRSVKLSNQGGKDVTIKGIKSNNPAVTASFKPVREGRAYTIEVKVDPTKITRDLKTAVEIMTDSNEQEVLSLNVYGILPPKAKG